MKQMPNKPLLTPAQIADKFVKVENPFCENEKRIKKLIRADMVEYIEMVITDRIGQAKIEWVSVPEIPEQY